MDGEVNGPLEQAEDAIREAIRKLEGGMCPKCGRTDPHGDEDHWSVSLHARPPYPQCSNGPDCQCPFHFGLQRVRVACPVCGLVTEHGDRLHQYRLGASGYELTPGPDLMPLNRIRRDQAELELRRRRREIAESGSWHAGTCTNCRLSDEPVKGPPGAELCRWCDELRILAPAPAPAKPPEPTFRQFLTAYVASRSFAISCALLLTGSVLMLTGGGYFLAGAALWLAGFFWPTQRR